MYFALMENGGKMHLGIGDFSRDMCCLRVLRLGCLRVLRLESFESMWKIG
jgi:hypothetical protein